MDDEYNFLLLGSGCRESQMALKIRESHFKTKLYCISGYIQPQIFNICDNYFTYDMKNINKLIETCIQLCRQYNIHYVLIGSESFLMTSLVFELEKKGVFCVAPNHFYSRIETSKLYCRRLLDTTNMVRYNPDYIAITQSSSISYILYKLLSPDFRFWLCRVCFLIF